MLNLPKEILETLEEQKYSIIEVIQESTWKKTYILKVLKDNSYFIVKAYSKQTPDLIQNKFKSEMEFYKNKTQDYLPRIVFVTENILIMEFIEGITLRESLINNIFTEKHLKKIFQSIDKLYIDNKKIVQTKVIKLDNAFLHLSALVQSGPIQTLHIKNSFMKKVINRFLLIGLKLKLKYIISNIDKTTLKSGFVHGDFHYNNILIKNLDIKFIDFENVNYNGYFDFDILYLLVMMEVYLENNNFFINEVNKFLDNNEELIKIYNLYKKAIKFNNKFKMTNI